MGGGNWDTTAYASVRSLNAIAGTSNMAYNDDVIASTPRSEWKAHQDLEPKGVAVRESRDSTEHPEALPIAIGIDVTGSMSRYPRIIQDKLPALLDLILKRGYTADPQILIAAIGDANWDRVPLQVGQFESDIRINDNLGNLVLEGGGGGGGEETYELFMYFMATRAKLDCVEKRGKKGYLFMIGDEVAYPTVKANLVKKIIGDDIPADIPTADIVAQLNDLFEVFFIIPSAHARPERVQYWRDHFGQNVLLLDDVTAIAETVAMTVGLCEGTTSLDKTLEDLDVVDTDVDPAVLTKALATVGGGPAPDEEIPDGGDDGVTRV